MIVHQIFGIFGDEMPELFKKQQIKTKKWVQKNGYTYKLWDKKRCLNLISKYPEFRDMYMNTRNEVMKVDIARFLILYHEGGLYLDMDVEPKIKKLKNYEWACDGYKNAKTGREEINMEILQSVKGNPLNLEFIRYQKKQIEEKSKNKIYDKWKGRYVLQTTGPRSLARFLKENKITPYTYRSNNATKYNNKLTLNETGKEDFITLRGCTWL